MKMDDVVGPRSPEGRDPRRMALSLLDARVSRRCSLQLDRVAERV